MGAFRYQARALDGATVSGEVDADDRRAALALLADRSLFPSRLEPIEKRSRAERNGVDGANGTSGSNGAAVAAAYPPPASRRAWGRVSRKDVSAFTREMATLLAAAIPIPAALDGLGSQEESAALRAVILDLAAAVRGGSSLSAAMAKHTRLFPPLYTSMVQVGEEAGALDKVMADLADLLEREDEIRGEVLGAVAYPCFVLAMGVATTFILLAFVLPRLFGMLEGMTEALPLPTRVLLALSRVFQSSWPLIAVAAAAATLPLLWLRQSPKGILLWDAWKLRLPILGGVFRASALGRFARTLGTLVHAGVSLLPALAIVQNTIGNRFLACRVAEAAEDTRGGDSLAAPLRKLGLFPPAMLQMVAVGEETGRLDAMLLRVATMQERVVRSRSRTLISLLAPALILVVGAVVGFIVIALLLPIFRMSQAIR
jgi:type II secretory pathway component PulF